MKGEVVRVNFTQAPCAACGDAPKRFYPWTLEEDGVPLGGICHPCAIEAVEDGAEFTKRKVTQ